MTMSNIWLGGYWWLLVKHPQNSKNTEQCEEVETETDSLSNCHPLPKHLQKAKPCDDTNESNISHINKEEGQYFDLNEVDDVFITYQQNSEEFHSAKTEE